MSENFALRFPGNTASRVRMYTFYQDVLPFDHTGPMTISAWVCPFVVDRTSRQIFSDDNFNEGLVAINSTGMYYCHGIKSTGTVPFEFEPNKWYHVCYTLDRQGSISILKIFINGIMIVEASGSNTASYFGPEGPLTIGYNFNGIIDDVRVWDYAKTDDEVESEISLPLFGDEEGLVGYWKFDEGTGNVVQDSSKSGMPGAIEGSVTWVESPIIISDVYKSVNGSYVSPQRPNENLRRYLWWDISGNNIALLRTPYDELNGYFQSATFDLEVRNLTEGTEGTLRVGRIAQSWDHFTVTNNNCPNIVEIREVPFIVQDGKIRLDVTQEMRRISDTQNHGIAILGSNTAINSMTSTFEVVQVPTEFVLPNKIHSTKVNKVAWRPVRTRRYIKRLWIERNGVEIYEVSDLSKTSFLDTGLDPETEYTYEMFCTLL